MASSSYKLPSEGYAANPDSCRTRNLSPGCSKGFLRLVVFLSCVTAGMCDVDADVDTFLGIETKEALEVVKADEAFVEAKTEKFHTPTLEELREYFRKHPERMKPKEMGDVMGNKFQGDIVATETEIKELYGESTAREAKEAGETVETHRLLRSLGAVTRSTSKYWWGGVVPYDWDSSAYNDVNIRMDLTAAMVEITAKTGGIIRFRRKTSGKRVVYKKEDGCFSTVGAHFWPWGQTLSLADNCSSKGTAIHELLHALGMHHQQSIYNRDNYVTILWDNIRDSKKHNFKKETHTTTFGQVYDYGSIMHYPERVGSSMAIDTSKKVIDARGNRVGQRLGMSTQDISELVRMYKCPTKATFSTVGRYHDCKCEQGLKKRYMGVFNARAVCNDVVLRCPDLGMSYFSTTGIHHGCTCSATHKKVYKNLFKAQARCEPKHKTCPGGSFSTTGYWHGCHCSSTQKKRYLNIFKSRARCEPKHKTCPSGKFSTTGYWRGCHCCCGKRKHYGWFKARAECK